ncbi:MAG: hypothetical protein Fur0012_10380 [Elusimicrobiota bacterium]
MFIGADTNCPPDFEPSYVKEEFPPALLASSREPAAKEKEAKSPRIKEIKTVLDIVFFIMSIF